MITITIAPTPNPNSLKFAADGATFLTDGLRTFGSAHDAADDELGARLFSIEGVQNVFIVPGFVTVTKHPAAGWDRLAEAVQRVLTEYLSSSAPSDERA